MGAYGRFHFEAVRHKDSSAYVVLVTPADFLSVQESPEYLLEAAAARRNQPVVG